VQGTPSTPLAPDSNGVTLKKTIWTMSGQPADLANLHQNDRVLIELSGQLPNNFYRQMGLIDLLPAGLEIESTLTPDDGKGYAWLDQLSSTTIADAHDDRYIAAFDVGSQYQDTSDEAKKKPEPQPVFHVAYIARAVTAGTFVLPAGFIEDMYGPSVESRTDMGSVTIK
jgi:uncharacterized protein YfaS (alpha-2-macroglobulin family)